MGAVHYYGQATAKSSVGRLDVLARLIVDGMDHYEAFHPQAISPAVPTCTWKSRRSPLPSWCAQAIP